MENVNSVKRRLLAFTIRKRYKPQFYKKGTPFPKGISNTFGTVLVRKQMNTKSNRCQTLKKSPL